MSPKYATEEKNNKRPKAITALSMKGTDKLAWMWWRWGVRKQRKMLRLISIRLLSEQGSFKFESLVNYFYLEKSEGIHF